MFFFFDSYRHEMILLCQEHVVQSSILMNYRVTRFLRRGVTGTYLPRYGQALAYNCNFKSILLISFNVDSAPATQL